MARKKTAAQIAKFTQHHKAMGASFIILADDNTLVAHYSKDGTEESIRAGWSEYARQILGDASIKILSIASLKID